MDQQLAQRIKVLVPAVDFDPFTGNVVIQDDSDGNGPYIRSWNVPGVSQPSDAELLAVTQQQIDALPENVLAINRTANNNFILNEITTVETEAASLQALVDSNQSFMALSNAQKDAFIKRLTEDMARLGRDVAKLARKLFDKFD